MRREQVQTYLVGGIRPTESLPCNIGKCRPYVSVLCEHPVGPVDDIKFLGDRPVVIDAIHRKRVEPPVDQTLRDRVETGIHQSPPDEHLMGSPTKRIIPLAQRPVWADGAP